MFYFGRTIGNKFINNQIIYPPKIDFSKYLKSSIKNSYYNNTGIIYYSRLGKKAGHYTASCLCDNDDSWYHFNDSVVTKEEKNRNAYQKPIILIYEKKNKKLKF